MSLLGRNISLNVKKWLGMETPPVVLAYRGYGTPQRLFLRGHVLDDRLLYEPEAGDSKRKNIRAMISRYFSTAVPEAEVTIEFAGQQQTLCTDEAGQFDTEWTFEQPLEGGWHPIVFRVRNPLPEPPDALERHGEAWVSNGQHEYGVISDVDDTILVSHATRTLRKLRLILTKNAKTRLPFPGVPAFYQALCWGQQPESRNPIFFISSSEWNLYDFLVDFCEARNIPKGIFLLQHLKMGLRDFLGTGGGSHSHKLDKARHLMEVFPDTSFILIGDSGQRDAYLYAQLADEYPERVLAVYIRDVTNKKNSETIHKLYQDHPQLEGKVCLSDNTYDTAKHAHEQGWISEEQLAEVRLAIADEE
jgi:phosphatidate phosphatase APP1